MPKAYGWETSRNTFPVSFWIEIIFEFLTHKYSKTELQKKYKQFLEKSKSEKSDNNMHINVLFKKLLIDDEQPFETFQKMTRDQVIQIIINHTLSIIDEMRKHNLTKKWKEQIAEFEKEIELGNHEIDLSKIDNTKIENAIINSSQKEIIKVPEYDLSKWEIIDNLKESLENEHDEDNLRKIGQIGESIVNKLLIKEYGIDNVIHMAPFDKYAPYDFRVRNGNSNIYFEVKTSTRMQNMNWYISRREYAFYEKNKDVYNIIFVRNLNPREEDSCFIQQVEKPRIEISDDFFGIKKGVFYVTPSKYKGLI